MGRSLYKRSRKPSPSTKRQLASAASANARKITTAKSLASEIGICMIRLVCVVARFTTFFLLVLIAARAAGGPTEAADSPPGVSPGPATAPVPLLSAEEEARTFKLPAGFHAEVVAQEPLIEH